MEFILRRKLYDGVDTRSKLARLKLLSRRGGQQTECNVDDRINRRNELEKYGGLSPIE